jgi:single-stranded-DNA-specific exonuclease
MQYQSDPSVSSHAISSQKGVATFLNHDVMERSFVHQWLDIHKYSFEQFKQLTSWNLSDLPDFSLLCDMDKAVSRISHAIKNKESIAIFGDYDVDGTTSCALLYRFFQKLSTTVKLYQPSRFIEGYGLHPSSVELAKADGVQILITVDCGSSSHQAAEKAKELGIDLVITDHHKDAAPLMPPCFAFINPNRRDEPPSELKSLAGVGVAFALAVCLRKELLKQNFEIPSLYDLLPYVAIGTISDLAPLNATNLILCRHGFKAMMQSRDLGLKKFLENKHIDLKCLDSEFISFLVGPMINSKGRLDHPEAALQLLIENDSQNTEKNFHLLQQTNSERKIIQHKVFEEAKKLAQEEVSNHPKISSLVLYNPTWHEGVIGIVASKITEEFKLPCLIFTNADSNGLIKASARTARGIDIFECLKTQGQYFKKFGGHKAAAGLTMEHSHFLNFKMSFLDTMTHTLQTHSIESQDVKLFSIDFSEIDGQLLEDIYRLAPFGQANPMPKWKIMGAKLQRYEILKDHHVKWHFVSHDQGSLNFQRQLKGISFNFLKKHSLHDLNNYLQNSGDITIEGWIKANQFRGSSHLNLQVDRIIL